MRQWLMIAALGSGCVTTELDKSTPTDDPVVGATGDTGVPEVDADGDGFVASVDCDETDPLINPGAVELCDGIDNDCTTVADDGKGVASIGTGEAGVLYSTLDMAVAAALEVPGTTIDVCPGAHPISPLALVEDDQLTLRGVAGRVDTVVNAVNNVGFATLEGDAELTIDGITVSESLFRAFVLRGESVLTLIDANVSDNPGGGVLIAEGSDGVELNVQGSNFSGNVVADEVGGAILAEGQRFDITVEQSGANRSRFFDNGALRGGAIGLVNRPGAELSDRQVDISDDVDFTNNVASEYGGAIYSVLATIELDQTEFVLNAAILSGGAVELINSSLTMSSTTMSSNQATWGGALSLDEFGFSSVTGGDDNVSVVDNLADEMGGALTGSGAVTNVFFARNQAPVGGAVHVPSGAFLTVDQSDFDANVAIQGGALFLERNTDVDLVDVTFTLNETLPEFPSQTTTPPGTTTPPLPAPLPSVVEPDFAGLGGAAFLNDGAELLATTSSFGVDESTEGGIDNDNRPGDIFVRALGASSNHERLGLMVDVLCNDDGCLLIQAPMP